MSEPEAFQTPLEQGMFEHLRGQLALHNQYEDINFDSDSQTYTEVTKGSYGRRVITWQELW
jgi:hypothetical protein